MRTLCVNLCAKCAKNSPNKTLLLPTSFLIVIFSKQDTYEGIKLINKWFVAIPVLKQAQQKIMHYILNS